MKRQTILLLSAAAASAAAGQLLFRVGARGREAFLAFVNPYVFLGLAFYALGTGAWIYALASETLVNVYAFAALTFALVYLGSVFLLGERLTPAASAGVALVLAGLFLITRYGATS